MDALDGICIVVGSHKDNRYFTNFSEPAGNLNTVTAPSEINIDERHIGQIVHSERTGFLCAWSKGANVEAELEHCCFKVESD